MQLYKMKGKVLGFFYVCEIENGLVTFLWISYLCVRSYNYIE